MREWSAWIDETPEQDTDLIEGLIGGAWTTLLGKSEAGKSRFIVQAATTLAGDAGSIWGRDAKTNQRILLLANDPGAEREYAKRIQALSTGVELENIYYASAPTSATESNEWERARRLVDMVQPDLIVFDHMNRISTTHDINTADAAKQITSRIGSLSSDTIPLLVVGHPSKSGKGKQSGSFAFQAISRRTITLDKRQGVIVSVTAEGNECTPNKLTLKHGKPSEGLTFTDSPPETASGRTGSRSGRTTRRALDQANLESARRQIAPQLVGLTQTEAGERLRTLDPDAKNNATTDSLRKKISTQYVGKGLLVLDGDKKLALPG